MDSMKIAVKPDGCDTLKESSVPGKAPAADSGSREEPEGDMEEVFEELRTDENGNPILSDYAGSREIVVPLRENMKLSEYSTNEYLMFESVSGDCDYTISADYSLSLLGEYTTEQSLAESLDSLKEVYADAESYAKLVLSGQQSAELNGRKIKFVVFSGEDTEGGFFFRDISAWTVLDGGYAVNCRISEISPGQQTPETDGALVKGFFEGIA